MGDSNKAEAKRGFALVMAFCAACIICSCGRRAKDKYYDLEFHCGGRDARPENIAFSELPLKIAIFRGSLN